MKLGIKILSKRSQIQSHVPIHIPTHLHTETYNQEVYDVSNNSYTTISITMVFLLYDKDRAAPDGGMGKLKFLVPRFPPRGELDKKKKKKKAW